VSDPDERPAPGAQAPCPSPPPAGGQIQIVIDEEGNVILSDLPEELGDLVKSLTGDEALLSRFCPLPEPEDL
jgi:hypothetical protein